MGGGRKIRKLGLYILFTGILLLVGTGIYQLLKELVIDTELPVILKLGIIGVVAGLIILLLSLIRERVEEVKNDRS